MKKTDAIALGRRTIAQEVESLSSASESLGEAFWEACALIAGCTGIVWVTGVGTSAATGIRFSHILTDCGVRSVFLSPDMGLHGHSGAMIASEVLVAISRGGESSEVNQMVTIANARSLATLAMVNGEASTLAALCRIVLPVHSPTEHELGGYCATTSTVVCSAVCDAIAAVVLKLRGYTFDEFSTTHPGGAVGLNSRRVDPGQGGKV